MLSISKKSLPALKSAAMAWLSVVLFSAIIFSVLVGFEAYAGNSDNILCTAIATVPFFTLFISVVTFPWTQIIFLVLSLGFIFYLLLTRRHLRKNMRIHLGLTILWAVVLLLLTYGILFLTFYPIGIMCNTFKMYF